MNDFQGFEAMHFSHFQVRNEISQEKKKKKFLDMRTLTIVCAEFNNWKLTTSLFLFFYDDNAVFTVPFKDK